MCDYFSQRMDGDHHHLQAAGDLTDIVRAGGVGLSELPSTATEWHLSAAEPGTLFPPPQPSSSDGAAGPSGGDGFGDALAALPDPFGMTDFRANSGAGTADFFDFEAPLGGRGGALVDSGGAVPRGTTTQMPVLSPREIRPYPGIMAGGDAVKQLGMPTMMPRLAVGPPCAFDAVGGLQMPSPRGGGIKRRFGTMIASPPDLCNSRSHACAGSQ